MISISAIRAGIFFFSSRRRHTRYWRDWSSDVCSSDLSVRGRWPHRRGSDRNPDGAAIYREQSASEVNCLTAIKIRRGEDHKWINGQARGHVPGEEALMKDRDSATLAMKAGPIRWLCTLIALTLGIAILGPIPLVAQGDYQTVNAAMDKVITTPTHIYNVTTDVPK